jgi:hypothetical protein
MAGEFIISSEPVQAGYFDVVVKMRGKRNGGDATT